MYSASSRRQKWDKRLVGINLDFPSTYLNAPEAFIPPRNPDVPNSAFLWQAPSSNAILLTGEKWAELHDFISRSLDFQQASSTTPAIVTDKVVSTIFPGWLESLVQLCRLRGYVTLYPGLETAATLAMAHDELPQYPEEYRSADSPPPRRGKEVELGDSSLDTLHTLPNDGDLLPLGRLPFLDWKGEEMTVERMDEGVRAYLKEWREAVGCKENGNELFC